MSTEARLDALREGAEVRAVDGKVGLVKEVQFDLTGKISSFTVEKGHFFIDDFMVPLNLVESVKPECIKLKVSKEELRNDPYNPKNQAGFSLSDNASNANSDLIY
ncbi:MAG TPA: PRC-barrel domain-containing protein [Chloroflexia bacterium]|nr:PRC-barrel domain-containing protein [Chloroflexia bacterium]